ncbi:hypothetical protein [Haliangium ochraceum]|uniref:FHA domain containing protein n=1 Tax=Haliangium ochraceum (strain DSM 14365 / JCM 11303 / SMP-2) TaxID=502025 RepID=D0LW40_HALO1|nr:hypothetical protein [Haliangium ochraceum]ACY15972.1 hypothetical protein Hoch_3470 [Haliangium ochraceum DSM 14365]
MADAIILIDHLRGSLRGTRQAFPVGTRVRLGRHPDGEVVFHPRRDLEASSRHAELVPVPQAREADDGAGAGPEDRDRDGRKDAAAKVEDAADRVGEEVARVPEAERGGAIRASGPVRSAGARRIRQGSAVPVSYDETPKTAPGPLPKTASRARVRAAEAVPAPLGELDLASDIGSTAAPAGAGTGAAASEEYLLRDVGSSNGTFVGGRPCTELRLSWGVPVIVDFGLKGPRVRVYVGPAERVPAREDLSAAHRVLTGMRSRRRRIVLWCALVLALAAAVAWVSVV